MVIIFWPTSDEEWRKLHNVELNDLYFSPNIVRVIKLRMRWVGHVARMGERRDVYRVLVGNVRKKGHLEDQGVDRSIILRWTRLIWLRIRTGGLL